MTNSKVLFKQSHGALLSKVPTLQPRECISRVLLEMSARQQLREDRRASMKERDVHITPVRFGIYRGCYKYLLDALSCGQRRAHDLFALESQRRALARTLRVDAPQRTPVAR
jgi:hypothetical protein